MQPKLADWYIPDVFTRISGLGSASSGTGTWPVANKALYLPVIFPYAATLTTISFGAANGTGNYDLGFYDGYTKNKIQSTGSTAMTAAGVKTMTFTVPIRVDAGRLYYAALALSSASGTTWRANPVVLSLIGGGCAEQTSALPLPSSMTPVTIIAAYIPYFSFGIR